MKFHKVALLFFSLVLLSGFIAAGWYMRQLEHVVTAKFEGPKWQFPSKIYSDTFPLYSGMDLPLEDLWEKLRHLGYTISRNVPTRRGEHRFLKREGLLEIYLHDFNYPSESFKGFPVRITMQGSTIAKMERTDTAEEIFSFELEPELVAGLYDRIWEERRLVKLDEVPPLIVGAILAIEDQRFYRHRGIDLVAILRALWANLRSGAIVEGGSTLTQQLMKNFFLGDERTLKRKVNEALMALIAEWNYSKDEILENYLNEIYLGQRGAQGIFGVWEASQFYFSKELHELTIGEIAVLAGLIRAPNRYSPYRSVDSATQLRNVVLAKMFAAELI
ncbi:MAG: transglycosylase domain-containing protein, partial [Candidatus Binatia bacterium]